MPKKLQHGARNDLVNVVKNKRQKMTNRSTGKLTNVITALSNQILPQQNQLPQNQLPQQNQLPPTPASMQPTSAQLQLQPIIESTLELQLQQLREQIQREREESLPLHFQVRQLMDDNSRLQQSYDKLHDDVVMINSTRPHKRVHSQVTLDPNDSADDIPFQPMNNFLLRNRVTDHKVLEFSKIKPPSFTGNLKKDEYNYPMGK